MLIFLKNYIYGIDKFMQFMLSSQLINNSDIKKRKPVGLSSEKYSKNACYSR